jgi:hypothetical protein
LSTFKPGETQKVERKPPRLSTFNSQIVRQVQASTFVHVYHSDRTTLRNRQRSSASLHVCPRLNLEKRKRSSASFQVFPRLTRKKVAILHDCSRLLTCLFRTFLFVHFGGKTSKAEHKRHKNNNKGKGRDPSRRVVVKKRRQSYAFATSYQKERTNHFENRETQVVVGHKNNAYINCAACSSVVEPSALTDSRLKWPVVRE